MVSGGVSSTLYVCVACVVRCAFGGVSYTTFNVTVSGTPDTLSLAAIQQQLSSGVSAHLAAPLSAVTVTVTNTGTVTKIAVFAGSQCEAVWGNYK